MVLIERNNVTLLLQTSYNVQIIHPCRLQCQTDLVVLDWYQNSFFVDMNMRAILKMETDSRNFQASEVARLGETGV